MSDNERSDKEILDEIRAVVGGWHLYLKNPPQMEDSSHYIAAVRACTSQLDAILRTEKIMDIEERAAKWVEEYMKIEEFDLCSYRQDLINAYLAGVAQTQKDYTSRKEEGNR